MGILTIMLLIPLIGACAIFLAKRHIDICKALAVSASGLVLALSIYLWTAFDKAAEGYQFVVHLKWFPELGVSFALGLDGLALPFVLLTTLLCFLVIIYTHDLPQRKAL